MRGYMEEEVMLKCRKHRSKHTTTGVCPVCLRDRLIRLCPDCAKVRPCACSATTTSFSLSSSSSSSFSLSSSSDLPSSGSIGAIGRMSNLIDNEPAFQRSRSTSFPFLRSKIFDKDSTSGTASRSKLSFWSSVFKVQKLNKIDEEEEKNLKSKMTRSKSVGMSDHCRIPGSDVKLKGRSWHFPSPIKAFRQSKTCKIVQERSPLCRG